MALLRRSGPSALRSALVAASAAAVAIASAGDARAIVGGGPDTTHVEVVAIQPVSPSCGQPPTQIQCTGTLVAPRIVVTAAHCLNDVDTAQLMTVTFAADVATATDGDRLRAIDARIDPSWTNGVDDVALLRLEQDAPVAPATLDLTSQAKTSASVTVVGFGADGAGNAGKRLSGTALVGTVRAGDFEITASPAMTCNGDSGGPAFENEGSGEQIVGITSYGDEACTTGTEMRVDALSSFVTSAMADLSAAVPPRPALDASVDTCTATCASHADCPIGMWCVARDDGTKGCAIAGLDPGHFGASCTQDDGSTPCVTAGNACKLWLPCTPPASAIQGGCAVSRDAGGSWWLAVVFAGLIARALFGVRTSCAPKSGIRLKV